MSGKGGVGEKGWYLKCIQDQNETYHSVNIDSD